MAVVNELVTLLSFKEGAQSAATLKRFTASIDGIKNTIKQLGGAVVAAQAAITGLTIAAGNQALAYEKLAQKTGLSADELQRFEYAATAVGANIQAVTQDIAGLYQTMTSPIPGELNETLLMLGINVLDASNNVKTADTIFLELADTLSKIDKQKALQWANKLGISNDTLLLLREGKIGVQELLMEAENMGAIIPSEVLKNGAEFKKNLDSIRYTIKNIGTQIFLGLSPAFRDIIKSTKDWIAENRKFITSNLDIFLKGIIQGLGEFVDMLKSAWQWINNLFSNIKGGLTDMDKFKAAATLIKGALIGLFIALSPLILAFAKFWAIGIIVAAVLEDFFGYLEGKDSLIGRLVDKFNAWLDASPRLQQAIAAVRDIVVSLYEALKELGKYTTVTLKIAIQLVSDFFEFLWDTGKGVGAKIAQYTTGGSDNMANVTDGGSFYDSPLDWLQTKSKNYGNVWENIQSLNPAGWAAAKLSKFIMPSNNQTSNMTNIDNSTKTINFNGITQSQISELRQDFQGYSAQVANPGAYAGIHQ